MDQPCARGRHAIGRRHRRVGGQVRQNPGGRSPARRHRLAVGPGRGCRRRRCRPSAPGRGPTGRRGGGRWSSTAMAANAFTAPADSARATNARSVGAPSTGRPDTLRGRCRPALLVCQAGSSASGIAGVEGAPPRVAGRPTPDRRPRQNRSSRRRRELALERGALVGHAASSREGSGRPTSRRTQIHDRARGSHGRAGLS